MADEFDVIVIGGGTADLTAPLAARHEGPTVALVERERRIGGDCTYNGCVPSKALIEIVQTVFDARRLAAAGCSTRPRYRTSRTSPPSVTPRSRRSLATSATSASPTAGIELVYGEAAFAGERELDVGGRSLRGGRFVVATGGEPAVPPIPGLHEVPHLTNRSVFELRELPPRLLVLGGGPIGLELAQAFHRLTVLEDTIAQNPTFSEAYGAALRESPGRDGR